MRALGDSANNREISARTSIGDSKQSARRMAESGGQLSLSAKKWRRMANGVAKRTAREISRMYRVSIDGV